MGRNIDDYLVFLRENASEIKSLGKQWGMDESEIASCVEEVLSRSRNIEKAKNSPMNIGRKIWRIFLMITKLSVRTVLVLFLSFACIYTMAQVHAPTGEYIGKKVQPYAYPIMRFLRLSALPIHDVINITHFYEAECILDNPFFVESGPDCRPCSVFKKIKEADGPTFPKFKFAAYAMADKPALLKKTYERNVTLGDLRKLYNDHKADFENDVGAFISNDPVVPNLVTLFDEKTEDYLNSSENTLIQWKVGTVMPTVAFRELFPRPSFLPEKFEVVLEKHIFIDSPNSGTHKLPSIHGPYRLYTQALGHRRILLRPVELCKDQCSSLLVIMEAGDSLLYNEHLYNMFISKNGESMSIAYLTLFHG